MRLCRRTVRRTLLLAGLLLVLPAGLAAAPGGSLARAAAPASVTSRVTVSSLGNYAPTFAGPAATGCASGCDLTTGPFPSPSTASFALGGAKANSAAAAHGTAAASGANGADNARLLPSPLRPRTGPAKAAARAAAGASGTGTPGAASGSGAQATVSCTPLGPGCEPISRDTGGANGVAGLDAVDSASMPVNVKVGDVEPPDQGLCAGNGYVVEDNNIGEVLVFDTALRRASSVIPLDTLMGLTSRGWSSGGDISCLYDGSNGGHWFFTEFASASSEASGGPFAGCFNGVANTCYEAIAVSKGNSPFGPYNTYFVNANYNPSEPGAPYLLNDFAKIGVTRDAFLLFYDEFPQVTPGIGGGGFNGAQEFAFDKNAMERGLPVTLPDGRPNPSFTVAIENMGLLPTPDGTCASDSTLHQPGIACWFSVIPASPPDPSQFDNGRGGSGFMLGTLDTYGNGDTRVAAFDWTGLSSLNRDGKAVRFSGQLFSGTEFYFDPGLLAPQKTGPIPLGDECGAAGWSVGNPPPASCPESGVATNGDNVTQAGQSQGQLWGAVSTQLAQSFSGGSPENHMGVAYFAIGTRGFDRTGTLSLTSQGYVSAAHEDLTMPVIAGSDDRGAIIAFTLTGDGGPGSADGGGFYPSTAYVRLASPYGASGPVRVVDLGQDPVDGLAEYAGFPGAVSPRWGDYSAAVFMPRTGKIYFANEYIPHPSCTGAAFTLTIPTCGGTRDGNANWGTSVNSVTP